ncbi:hypothetical protein ACHAXT_010952 [Thalassiosira profunda]
MKINLNRDALKVIITDAAHTRAADRRRHVDLLRECEAWCAYSTVADAPKNVAKLLDIGQYYNPDAKSKERKVFYDARKESQRDLGGQLLCFETLLFTSEHADDAIFEGKPVDDVQSKQLKLLELARTDPPAFGEKLSIFRTLCGLEEEKGSKKRTDLGHEFSEYATRAIKLVKEGRQLYGLPSTEEEERDADGAAGGKGSAIDQFALMVMEDKKSNNQRFAALEASSMATNESVKNSAKIAADASKDAAKAVTIAADASKDAAKATVIAADASKDAAKATKIATEANAATQVLSGRMGVAEANQSAMRRDLDALMTPLATGTNGQPAAPTKRRRSLSLESGRKRLDRESSFSRRRSTWTKVLALFAVLAAVLGAFPDFGGQAMELGAGLWAEGIAFPSVPGNVGNFVEQAGPAFGSTFSAAVQWCVEEAASTFAAAVQWCVERAGPAIGSTLGAISSHQSLVFDELVQLFEGARPASFAAAVQSTFTGFFAGLWADHVAGNVRELDPEFWGVCSDAFFDGEWHSL